jgi:hypothetical protein
LGCSVLSFLKGQLKGLAGQLRSDRHTRWFDLVRLSVCLSHAFQIKFSRKPSRGSPENLDRILACFFAWVTHKRAPLRLQKLGRFSFEFEKSANTQGEYTLRQHGHYSRAWRTRKALLPLFTGGHLSWYWTNISAKRPFLFSHFCEPHSVQ